MFNLQRRVGFTDPGKAPFFGAPRQSKPEPEITIAWRCPECRQSNWAHYETCLLCGIRGPGAKPK